MDQPVASMAGVRAQEDSTSSSLMDDPRALEIEAAGGTWLWRRRTALGETKQTDRQTNQQWRRRAERSGREEALPGGVGHGPPAAAPGRGRGRRLWCSGGRGTCGNRGAASGGTDGARRGGRDMGSGAISRWLDAPLLGTKGAEPMRKGKRASDWSC